MIAELCGIKGEVVEIVAPPSAARIRALVAEHAGFGLIEPDLPIGKLTLPRAPVDRAVLALVTRGAPRALLFARGQSAKLAPVKDERALDFTVVLAATAASDEALFVALRAHGGSMTGKALLREVRAMQGSASTRDTKDLGRALVRAWSAGLIELV